MGDAGRALDRRDQFNVIDTATGWKVDLIIRKDRPFSIREFERRQPVRIAGVDTAVASVEDTILAKLEWAKVGGSDRQRSDVVTMLTVQADRIDTAYLEEWADILGSPKICMLPARRPPTTTTVKPRSRRRRPGGRRGRASSSAGTAAIARFAPSEAESSF